MLASEQNSDGERPLQPEQEEPHESNEHAIAAMQSTLASDDEAFHDTHTATESGEGASAYVPGATHSVQVSSATVTNPIEQTTQGGGAGATTTNLSPNNPDPSPNTSTYLRRNTMDAVLVMTTLQLLEVAVEKERMVHTLASVHFKALYDWFLFLPSILLTLVGGILAFVAQDDSSLEITESQSALFSTIVGVLSLVSVFWQSLTKQLNLGGRAMLHESAAVALKRIVEDMPFRQLDPNFSVQETDDYLKQTNEKFTQALESCNSVAPLRITSSFYAIRSQIELYLTLHDDDLCKEFDIKREEIYKAGSAEVYAIFSNYLLFPFVLPSSTYVTKNATRNLMDKFKLARDAHAKA